uniref:Uncharacterized protein n=1 Tax=Triticum urartu TaxID=4572 RepID=A0A8R7QC98_TRIUA
MRQLIHHHSRITGYMWSKVAMFLVFQSVQNTVITPNTNPLTSILLCL